MCFRFSLCSGYNHVTYVWIWDHNTRLQIYKAVVTPSLQEESSVTHFLTNNHYALASFIRLTPTLITHNNKHVLEIIPLLHVYTIHSALLEMWLHVVWQVILGNFTFQTNLILGNTSVRTSNLVPSKPCICMCSHRQTHMNTRTHEYAQKQHSPYYSGKLTQPAASRAHSWNKRNVHT
jgi:hypothetical protein